MADPMCPAEMMRKAYDDEVERWEIRTILTPSLEVYHIRRCKGDPFDSDPETGWELKCSFPSFDEADEEYETLSRLAGHRAALRALANMDPTLPMYEVTKLNGASPFSCVEHCKDYIMVAAEEGEDKANG
jgi:hypothetical protein